MKPAASGSGSNTNAKQALVPTNTVTTKDGISVRARIDPSLAVVDVVRQLCSNLKVPEHPALYALRDEQDVLVTDENLLKKIKEKAHLKLVSSPVLEAVEIVEKLTAREDKSTKMALFSLQKYIQEDAFANEFLKRGGLTQLLAVISVSHGNTLAYALKALQNLMALDHGWANIPKSFVCELVLILANPHNLVNVSRPATSILKRLVEADPRFAPQQQAPTSTSRPGTGNGATNKPALQIVTNAKIPRKGMWEYGFDFVWDEMRVERMNMGHTPSPGNDRSQIRPLDSVVQKLSSGDTKMATDSMMLINSLLKNATDARWEELTNELERLNVRKAVVRLTSSSMMEDLSSQVMEFQANLISLAYRRKTTSVDPDVPSVRDTLNVIWIASKIPDAPSVPQKGRTPIIRSNVNTSAGTWDPAAFDGQSSQGANTGKWVKIGFESEDLQSEFSRVGLLGLDCLRILAVSSPEYFADVVLEQLSRPAERRCPVAKASNEVVELLSDHYQIFSPGYSTSSSFYPYFLSFHRVHNLALKFFLRIWNESSAASTDFARVAALVRSQIGVALKDETRPWHEVERDFLDSEYREVRERQMRELELEDDLLNKPPVRNVRAKLYKESFEFVRSQRIQCLMLGAWFVNGNPVPLSGTSSMRESITLKRAPRNWRFFRLDKSMRYLHYVDSVVKLPIRAGLEDLPERIEVAHILDVTLNTCALPPNIHTGGHAPSDLPYSSLVASPLSFSLLSTRDGSLADLVAENATSYSDWIDGLNMLRGDHFSTKETADMVQALTEIGLKIKLLDLSGEKVEIPSNLPIPPLPSTTDFFFSDYD
ncbi:hypothetical protein FRB94_006575 [Tulasnella sp. JGI-2019a]|nr:hypothetical protein FRB93_012084 [Tulasnella sp. JGI-2019a]KAG9012207.1 hypothetical protein FRB94_006575 [Tulasnella sp. JGI-2019a]KAG9036332.1 hypothetical protein FRB95_009254 [Tulasnella sp. JGI-2019a]